MPNLDRQPRKLTLAEQFQVTTARVVRGDLRPTQPMFVMLMESVWPTVNALEPKGFDPLEVPEQPESAGEAAVRQKVLTEWLKEGWTYQDFCRRFGGPANVIQTETQVYP